MDVILIVLIEIMEVIKYNQLIFFPLKKQFKGVLIIWDRIFGTFEEERLEDPPIYGLIKNENNFNQLWLQFHTLGELLFCKWREKDEENKNLKIFPKFVDKLKVQE